jgi:hypothetical protein
MAPGGRTDGGRVVTAGLWEATLDAFELRLVAQESALERGLIDPEPAFRPPAGMPLLPDELLERAQQLLRRSRALEESLTDARDAARGQLDRAAEGRAGRTGPAQPVYFDSRV